VAVHLRFACLLFLLSVWLATMDCRASLARTKAWGWIPIQDKTCTGMSSVKRNWALTSNPRHPAMDGMPLW